MINLKRKSLHFFEIYWPYLLMTFIVFAFFWKFFIKGLIPIPGDFVVGVYYPWLDYKWGFAAGVPVKNPILTDVVSFTYPMQTLAVDLIKSGKLPLWNSYILAGTPLLANFQSAPFSPTNFLYFLTDKVTAWGFQIILQHFLAAVFTFILLRYWKVSKSGSVIGAAVYAFSGFNLIWSQWNGHTLAAAFIPLILFFSDKLLLEQKRIYGAGISISLALMIFSGYPQTILYLGLSVFTLWLVRIRGGKNIIRKSFFLALFFVIGFGLAAFQILPGAELLKNSQRQAELHPFEWAFLPWQKTITFIAPDFFGNHATANYWGPQDYTSNTGFVGVAAFILASISAFLAKKKEEVLFGFIVASLSLILAFPTPLSIFLWKSGILGFNAASAHRSLVLWNFSVAILSAFGYDSIKNKPDIKNIFVLFIPFVLLAGFCAYAYKIHQLIGLRNLILPSVIFLGSLTILLLRPKFKILFLVLTIVELFYFGWKFTAFSPRDFIFPETPVLEFLENQPKPFRVVADKVIPINFLMNYRVETLEGYDAVYPKKISEFISKINGDLGSFNSIRRYGIIDDYNSSLLDQSNVKYLIVKNGDLNSYLKNKKFRVVFEDKSVDILENLNVYPRAYFLGDEKSKISKVNFLKYDHQEETIKVETPVPGDLIVSDTFYPGWKAYIDGKETEILPADYVFRAVTIPKGEHVVRFVYRPESFFRGVKISLFSLVVLMGMIGYTLLVRNKNVKT